MNSSFDNIAASYDKELKDSLGMFGGKDITLFADYKIKTVASKLSQEPANILEFGCGTGRNISSLKRWFPASNICGCDVSGKSLEIAHNIHPAVRFDKITSPGNLPELYKEPFDCIFISNVFHHIPFNEHQTWFDALYKILSGEGNIFVFEHNPYNPVTKYIFNHSSIDKGAAMLKPSYCRQLLQNAGFSNVKQEYTLFFPRRNTFFEFIEHMFFWLPFGCSVLHTRKKVSILCQQKHEKNIRNYSLL